jgi:NAD(P)-dependent dehydrogenase (short-subunit alcohol dehydrogenase family)
MSEAWSEYAGFPAPITWASSAIPSQAGRTAIVTGANSGIGLETAAALAGAGARVVLGCRSPERAAGARACITGRFPEADVALLRLDLADQRQIADAAGEVLDRFGAIDICINNAGLLTNARATTPDGFEMTFGVNHLGHFAFVGRVLPALLAAPNARVVTVTSMAHKSATLPFDDLHGERGFKPVRAYRQSKLANLLFTLEMQRRLGGSAAVGAETTSAVAAHPGVAATSFFGNAARPAFRLPAQLLNAAIGVLFLSASEGARPSLRAATDREALPAACYGPRIAQRWGRPAPVAPSKHALDADDAQRLWDISSDLTGVTYDL